MGTQRAAQPRAARYHPGLTTSPTSPLREAVGAGGDPVLVTAPFSSVDLEAWRKVAQDYRSDPVTTAQHLRYIIKQHHPDGSDTQLLLESLTETEKQLVLKTARDLAEDYYRAQQLDVKDYFPLEKPEWRPNREEERKKLESYREWVVKGMERAMPKTINWSELYAIKQGPSETPSEFLDRLRSAMHRHTPLDPRDETGIQQSVNLFLGQSTGDIRRKLQKIVGPESRNLEKLLDEAGQRTLGQDRKERICQTPQPRTVKELRTFLGMTGWCRLWICNYGLLVKPLHALTASGNRDLQWTKEATRAFSQLKNALMSAPALGLPDVSKPFFLFSHEKQGIALVSTKAVTVFVVGL